jgi:hypothetical protein
LCKIEFEIPEAGYVTVKVVDIIGSHVRTLINSTREPGKHIVDFNEENLPPGRYYYKVYLHHKEESSNGDENGLITSGQVKIKV